VRLKNNNTLNTDATGFVAQVGLVQRNTHVSPAVNANDKPVKLNVLVTVVDAPLVCILPIVAVVFCVTFNNSHSWFSFVPAVVLPDTLITAACNVHE
jgi:hypothetical protein